MTDSDQAEAPGAWAPLRHPVFRMLWMAQAFSLVGTWAQTVGAQWFLTIESGRPELIALVPTATSLPVLLLAVPAGALADVVDRRRMLIIVQTGMALVAVALAVVTLSGHLGAASLLAFTAALGAGVALTNPAFQATIPELVSRAELPAAAALNGVAVNLARAIGPALGGLLVALAGVGWTFAFNAVSYLVFVAALLRLPRTPPSLDPEPFSGAMRLAVGYVRASPPCCACLPEPDSGWVLPASALWALLPVVASSRLKLNSTGYGILLAALGVGAVVGAWQLGRIRTRLSSTKLLVLAAAAYALALVVLAVGRSTWIALAVLILAGAAWTSVLVTLNATAQLILPTWIRARALATYLLVFMGGQAVGSAVWGALAGAVSTEVSLLAAAGVLLLGLATLPVLPLPDPSRLDPSHSAHWPTPELALNPDEHSGAVLVTVGYHVLPDSIDESSKQWGTSRGHDGVPERCAGAYSATPCRPTAFLRSTSSPLGGNTYVNTSSGRRSATESERRLWSGYCQSLRESRTCFLRIPTQSPTVEPSRAPAAGNRRARPRRRSPPTGSASIRTAHRSPAPRLPGRNSRQ